jgi:hypothetical protein
MIDTRNKRASVLGFALVSLVALPFADATIDANDRAQVTFSYAGISAGIPVPPSPTPDTNHQHLRLFRFSATDGTLIKVTAE